MGSHPDADLHPVATGPAKTIVDAHQKEEPLKLYSGWFCPFVQRAWTVLEEKKVELSAIHDSEYMNGDDRIRRLRANVEQIPYQYIEVNPYNKPKELLDLNPRGLVPTFQYDGKPLFESTVICEFLEDAYPDHKPHLLPEDPYKRALTRIWTDFCTSRIIPAFHRFLQFQPMDDKEGLKEVREEFVAKWKELTKEMDKDGPFFFGKEPSLIDFVVAPWVVRLWVFDHFKEGLGIPEEGEGGDDEPVWTRFRKFRKAIEERPSIKNTTSETEHYLPIYERYHQNTAQSELAKATRKGRGVP